MLCGRIKLECARIQSSNLLVMFYMYIHRSETVECRKIKDEYLELISYTR